MVTIMISQGQFDDIIAGKNTEIHKPINKFYTSRFITRFGTIGDENIVEDIQIISNKKSWYLENKRVLSCTIRIGTGENYYKPYCKLPENEERYILTILDIKEGIDNRSDANRETYDKTKEQGTQNISMHDAAEILKKKKLCIQRKASGCGELCSECPFNIIESDLILACDRAVTTLSTDIQNGYIKGRSSGYKKAFREISAFEGLTTPREVVNAEGFKPYCQVCRSVEHIFTLNGNKNQFCGQCGTLLNWESVRKGEYNYDRLKKNSENAYYLHSFKDRREAIEEFLNENDTHAVMMREYDEPPVDAVLHDGETPMPSVLRGRKNIEKRYKKRNDQQTDAENE